MYDFESYKTEAEANARADYLNANCPRPYKWKVKHDKLMGEYGYGPWFVYESYEHK